MNEFHKKIVSLLTETARAHHEAFAESDGADPEWPLWYAGYLQERLPPLLEADLTRSELVYLLLLLEKRQALAAPGSSWAHFYAGELVARYRPGEKP